jgi:hypothetical protein
MTCNTAFAKHMFPLFNNPLGRIEFLEFVAVAAMLEAVGELVVRSVSKSFFLLGIAVDGRVGEDAGMEKPITDDVGKELGLCGEDADEELSRKRDAHDFFGCDGGGGGGGTGKGSSVSGSIEIGMCSLSGEDAIFATPEEVPAIDTDVFVVCGEPGVDVSGDVEPAGVVSAVTDEEGMKRSLRSRSGKTDSGGAGSSSTFGSGVFWVLMMGRMDGTASTTGACFGEGGGVGMSRACWTMSGGGRARGEMIIPGARDGSCGRRDQIAQPPMSGRGGEVSGGERLVDGVG